MKITTSVMLLAILLSIFIAGCSTIPEVIINDNAIEVEIAETPEQMQTGLMHRESLEDGKGMLFVFDKEKVQGFWMKNTLIPLDIIFISEDMTIKNIFEAEPCEADPCNTYDAIGKYVLEVNKGYSKLHNIKIGDKVVLKGLN